MKFLKRLTVSAQRLIFLVFGWGCAAVGILLTTFLCGDLLYSTFSMDLRPWHTAKLQHEFAASSIGPTYTFNDYIRQEEQLFTEVRELKVANFDSELDSPMSRFNPVGTKLTAGLTRDWNRSFVATANPERGVALLVHGLSDSPYSMRSTAEVLLTKGITVYVVRLPGHGTIPAGLDQITWRDWAAAVAVATQEIAVTKRGLPFFAVGYSTGGALLVKQAADDILSGNLSRIPRTIFLYSPALGITSLARFANLQRLVTGLGFLQKARWGNVDLEIDPFKYQSFAKNAGAQLSAMLAEVYESLDKLVDRKLTYKLPHLVSFQSVVDQTVNPTDLIGKLYGVINDTESELVLFGLNGRSGLDPFLRFSPQKIVDAFRQLPARNFPLTVITNTTPESPQVLERKLPPNSNTPIDRPLELSWPPEVFSLSHVAIPFPPDDQVYGYAAYRDGIKILNLGSLQMRGEKGVLAISATDQLRLKSNPFHAYILEKILGKIESDLRKEEVPLS